MKTSSSNNRSHYPRGCGPGELFDVKSYRGLVNFLIFSVSSTLLLWYIHDILSIVHSILSSTYEINRAKQEWVRLWALVVGGTGTGSSIIGLILMAASKRRQKSLNSQGSIVQSNGEDSLFKEL